MIRKEELLRRINEAIRTEESAISIYLENYSVVLERLGFDNARCDRIRKAFQTLGEESKQHKKILETLQGRLEKEPRDVF